MASQQQEQPAYQPKDALSIMTNNALVLGGFGAMISAIQNALARQNLGAMGFLTRFGGTAATFSMFNLFHLAPLWVTKASPSCDGRIIRLRRVRLSKPPRERRFMECCSGRFLRRLNGWLDT
jgi:hypothetical protein